MTEHQDHSFWDKSWKKAISTQAASPEAATWPNDIDRGLMEFLQPYLPATGRVTEIGCGSGRLLARIGHGTPLDLVAVDYTDSALQLVEDNATAFGVNVGLISGDARGLPFRDAEFDLVLSGGLLEHFEDPRPLLAEMVRVLKPGGAVFAAVVPRKLVSLHRPMHRWRGPKVFRTSFGPHRYGEWLRELGCEDIRVQSRGMYPPLIHHLPTALRRSIVRMCKPLNGTRLGDALGYYFVTAARRAI